MIDEEIKKALEYCASNALLNNTCDECPYNNRIFKYARHCTSVLSEDALDLINRQRAEIEKQSQNFKVLVSDHRILQQSFDNLKGLYEDEKSKVEKAKEKSIYFAKELQAAKAEIERLVEFLDDKCDRCIEKERTEAIKEFADNLCRVFAGHSDYHGDTILTKIICSKEGKPIQNAKPIDTSKIKSAAIKEFAKIVEQNDLTPDYCHLEIRRDRWDEIKKEMVGDAE